MGKRKRADVSNDVAVPESKATKKTKASERQENGRKASGPVTIQIVTGSYDRVLHGITATISSERKKAVEAVEFADTFLFNAHSSAIRCLALSPPSAPEPGRAQKVMLASGGSDERINVYNISAHPPFSSSPSSSSSSSSLLHNQGREKEKEKGATAAGAAGSMNEVLSAAAPRRILENPRNRELGTLLHHAASVTRLGFPTRAKLVSAAEDAAVAVTRTRDWALLSTIRAPVPRPLGRPSGDTAAPGGAPRGVADFAVHPSMKLMITVGRGERCMRLWNLMTARRAGVLNFGRDVLQQAGEGRHALGEGRRVVWGTAATPGGGEDGDGDGDGGEDELCVAFDRDLLVFGMDSTAKCRVMPDHRRKVHEVCYVVTDREKGSSLLAVSTEDGMVMFFSTRTEDLTTAAAAAAPEAKQTSGNRNGSRKAAAAESSSPLPVAKLVAQLGGKEAGVTGRIKDFSVLRRPREEGGEQLIIPTGSSDGKVRIFTLTIDELNRAREGKEVKQVGQLLGTYETSNRITCLEAFVMIPRPEGVEDSEDEDEFGGLSEDEGGDDSDSDE